MPVRTEELMVNMGPQHPRPPSGGGTLGSGLGGFAGFLGGMRERERIMDLFEASTGGRLHHVYFRIGGVNEDLPDGWTQRCAEFCDYFMNRLPEYDQLV